MSIYATLWALQFPKDGDNYFGCEWVEVVAQGVPPHIGSPTPGCGYEEGDPYTDFLPPPVETDENGEAACLRAVVFVTQGTAKGTTRSAQEYVNPLLVLTGKEYAAIPFADLHARLCDALREGKPRVVAQYFKPGGGIRTLLDDGTTREEGLNE